MGSSSSICQSSSVDDTSSLQGILAPAKFTKIFNLFPVVNSDLTVSFDRMNIEVYMPSSCEVVGKILRMWHSLFLLLLVFKFYIFNLCCNFSTYACLRCQITIVKSIFSTVLWMLNAFALLSKWVVDPSSSVHLIPMVTALQWLLSPGCQRDCTWFCYSSPEHHADEILTFSYTLIFIMTDW